MATIADFVGTWYLNGDRKQPRTIKLQGNNLSVQDIGLFSFDGNNMISYGNTTGILTSDFKRIAWSYGHFWDR
jgi:hypothetical protein